MPGLLDFLNPDTLRGILSGQFGALDQPPQDMPTDISAQSRQPVPMSMAPAINGPVPMPQQPPAPAPMPMGGPAQEGPGIGDRLGMAAKGFLGNLGSGPVGSLLAGAGALVTGQPTDPATISQQKTQRGLNATQQGLISRGANPGDVQAAMTAAANGNTEPMNALIKMHYAAPTDEIREFEYNQKDPRFAAYKIALKKAGATNVNTNVNNVNGGGSDKQVFDAVDESAKVARSSALGLAGLQEAKAALKGGIISGAGANQMLFLQKAGAALGMTDPTKVINTETFRSAITPQIAATIKATVGTANISNPDREFAEKAAGGNITLDAGSIGRLIDIMERASRSNIEQHNQRLDAIYPHSQDGKFRRERALFGVQAPAASAPSAGNYIFRNGKLVPAQ